MINPEQSPDDGYRLEDLIKMLIEGSLPMEGTGNRVFLINSVPAMDGSLTLGPTGNPEIGFGQKFEKDFQGWERGERVKTRFRVIRDEDKDGNVRFGLQVSESVVRDTRNSDTFYLDNLSDDEEEALVRVGMAELEAVVQVGILLHPEYQVSNMQDYTARIDRIIGIQKVWDGDKSNLKENNPVLIEGEVVEYSPDREYPYEGAHITLKMKTGQKVRIKLRNGYLDIEGGVIDTFAPSHPVVGDVVQMNTTYRSLQFSASYCRSTYLIRPEQKRKQLYDAQRGLVRSTLITLKQAKSSQEVRQVVASLIKYSFTKDTVLNLNDSEKRQIQKLVNEKIKKDSEKPLDWFDDIYGLEELKKGYGVDPYTMSKDEFFEFCLLVARGQRRVKGDASADSPWRVMRGNLTPKQQKKILSEAIIHFAPKVMGKMLLMKKDILVAPENLSDLHERPYGHRVGNKVVVGKEDYSEKDLANPDLVTWDDYYLFNQALSYFSDQISADASDLYISLISRMNDEELFMKEEEGNVRRYSEYEIMSAMKLNLQHNVIWKDNEWGTKIVGLKNIPAAKAYIKQVNLFKEFAVKLESKGWTNDGVRNPSEGIEEFLGVLVLIEEYLKSVTSRDHQ